MKNLVIILCLLIFNSSAFSDSTNNLVTDKHKDNEWVVSYITKNSIHASVNGQVTHGAVSYTHLTLPTTTIV